MYYLFIDESGDHGLRNLDPSFPVFNLCAVLFSRQSYDEADENINSLKREFWGDKSVVFHSTDIRRCRKEFQILLDLELKAKFISHLNSIMNGSDYTVFSSGVRKEDFIKKFGKLHRNIYEVCLSFIIERLVFFMDDQPQEGKAVKIVMEERGKKEDRTLKESFNRLMQTGTGFVTPARLKAIGLEIHFRSKAKNINGLQISDLIAYPIAQYILDPKRANPAFDIIKSKIYNKNGKVYGLKISP
jgi:hypothetical protein